MPSEIETLAARSPFPLSSRLKQTLVEAYQSPPRHYHCLTHVLEVAEHFTRVARGPGWSRPIEVFAAVLFHDAVYQVGQHDNEALSAALATRQLDVSMDLARVAALIELTARHGHLSPEEVDPEAALFLDCDMAILGTSPEAFTRYGEQIRAEYAPVVEPALYTAGRAAFLSGLLARPRIYLSDFFHAERDAAARRNLRAALAER